MAFKLPWDQQPRCPAPVSCQLSFAPLSSQAPQCRHTRLFGAPRPCSCLRTFALEALLLGQPLLPSGCCSVYLDKLLNILHSSPGFPGSSVLVFLSAKHLTTLSHGL